jgi:hypothetical protein
MGCRSDYLEPTARERELGLVLSLLAELDGQQVDHSKATYAFGYENRRDDLDARTAELCARCQATDVTRYSLELQIWWRDHQAADRRRQEKEAADGERQRKIAAAKSKLSPEELELLGIR